MTNRQARLLFGLLADLSTARNASRMSGRRAVENVAAGAKMAPGEVRAILDHLDDEIARANAEGITGGADGRHRADGDRRRGLVAHRSRVRDPSRRRDTVTP